MKRFIALSMAVIMSASLFAGCGGGSDNAGGETKTEETSQDEEKPAEEEKKEEEPKEEAKEEAAGGKLTFSVWDLNTSPYLTELAETFESENEGVEIELVDLPSADYTSKLGIDLNGGTAADVFLIKDADTSYSLNQKGQLADLTQFVSESGLDLGTYNGLAENFNFDGKQVGIPFRTDYYLLFYNKAIFDEAGEAYPTNDMTWAQFEETAKKITSGEGANKKYGAYIHTWQACVENWAVQDGKETIMGPSYDFMKPAYEMVLRMQNEDQTIQDFATLKTGNIHYSSPFQLGNVGMLPMGSWFMSMMIAKIDAGESDVDWAVATLPHPEGGKAGDTVGSTTPIAINGASENQELAWKFVEFCTTGKGAAILANAGQIPGCVDDALLATIASAEGMPEGASDALKVENIVLDRPIVEYVNEVNKMLEEQHGLVMLGEDTLDEFIATVTERSAEIQNQ